MAQSQCDESRTLYFPKQETATFSRKNAAVDRRHSVDGVVAGLGQRSGQGSDESGRFYPYRRQYSDGGPTGGVTSSSHPFVCLQELRNLDSFPGTHPEGSIIGDQSPWGTNNSIKTSRLMDSQRAYPEPPAALEEPACFVSPNHATYSPLSPLQQLSPGVYPTSRQSNSSQYSLHCLSTPSLPGSPVSSLFPKPVYSYSILIFMALRNSKTGSLPVSEIYSFMTENFPYFKEGLDPSTRPERQTAPDGWKNSVRHNLSLNKCFEKVENKNGNSSRKGCLWALNPAKVEKMQEELHKWRRKDPLTVRKSMARPEDLDHLLGERQDKMKTVSAYHRHNSTSRSSSDFIHPFSLPQAREPCPPSHPPRHLHPHIPLPSLAVGQHPHHYLPPTAPHPSPFYTPCGQQPSSGVPPTMDSLDSPLAGQTPHSCSAALLAEYGVDPKSMQELLMDMDNSNDIDMLNPSLTDLQLHGNFWEQLREDSVAPDSLLVITATPSSTSTLPTHVLQGSSLRSANESAEVIATGKGLEVKEIDLAGGFDHQMNGLYTSAYPGVENLSLYLTSTGTTPIPLL